MDRNNVEKYHSNDAWRRVYEFALAEGEEGDAAARIADAVVPDALTEPPAASQDPAPTPMPLPTRGRAPRTVAELHRERALEAQAAMAAIAKMPPPAGRGLLGALETVEARSAGAVIGFAPVVGKAERVAASWDRAFAKANAERYS